MNPKRPPDGEMEEENLARACAAVLEAGLVPSESHNRHFVYPIRKAARDFGVDSQKLRRRIDGIKSPIEAHDPQRKITRPQEGVLVKWIQEAGAGHLASGGPWTHEVIRQKASLIAGCPVGKNWTRGLVGRNPDLKSWIGRPDHHHHTQAEAFHVDHGTVIEGPMPVQPHGTVMESEDHSEPASGELRLRNFPYVLTLPPPPPPHPDQNATPAEVWAHLIACNDTLRKMLDRLSADKAQMALMKEENEELRRQVELLDSDEEI